MATINLGNIKFNWQGAYAGGTAYAVDDVVSYNGSSYICKLASTGNVPTNTTYWDQMSSAGTNGTNGTDLTTTLTTQGDLVYRDGAGLQRLGAGTAGQLLQTGGAGANVSWVNAPVGGAISANMATINGQHSTTSTSYQSVGSGLSVTVTPSSTSSKFLIISSFICLGDMSVTTIFRGSTNLATEANASSSILGWNGNLSHWSTTALSYLDAPNTTSSITYELKFRTTSSGVTTYVGDGTSILNTLNVIEL